MLNSIKIFKGDNFHDRRGYIWTSWSEKKIPIKFKHDKFATFKKNVLRGFHWDDKTWKLMSCPFGEILLVIVNCKKNSKQYLKHTSFKISHKNNTQILIPPNFGNATLCLSNEAVLHYKLYYEGNYNDVSDQQSMKWNDNRLKFKWPKKKFILSKRDK